MHKLEEPIVIIKIGNKCMCMILKLHHDCEHYNTLKRIQIQHKMRTFLLKKYLPYVHTQKTLKGG